MSRPPNPALPTTVPDDPADVDLHRLTATRTGKGPVLSIRAGPVVLVHSGAEKAPWSVNELTMCDIHDYARVQGRLHDAAKLDRRIRPADVKTTIPDHTDRSRSGCYILRGRQHSFLSDIPDDRREDNGFTASGNYLFAVYEQFDDLIVVLDTVEITATDLDRITSVDDQWYDRDGCHEASVEWTDVPGIDAETMHQTLDVIDVFVEAVGRDRDEIQDEIQQTHREIERAV